MPTTRLMSLARSLIDFCYPGRCEVCAEAAADSSLLCDDCNMKLSSIAASPYCVQCAMPLPEPDAPCPHCDGKGAPHYEKIVRLGTFADPLKHLIHRMKYHRRWPLAEHLADRALEQEAVKTLLSETDVIVPMPLHPLRQIQRGYNQADLIARRLARQCRVRCVAPLVRLRNTETQTHLHSHARRVENLRDAFALSDTRRITGKHVLVVDDVMTTGATLQSAARTLKTARPASLSALVLAIADRRRHGFEAI